MAKKMVGIVLLFICSIAVYGGMRFIIGVAGNAVLSLRSRGFTPVEGIIEECVIKTTGSGSGPRSQAGGRRAVSNLSYHHPHIIVGYEVDGKKYSTRMFRNIFSGGYPSLEKAMEAIQSIAPGQSVTWESYTEKNIAADEADYLCSLNLDSMVHTAVALKHDPENPAKNDLQVTEGSVLKLVLGIIFFIFGAGMFFLLFRFFIPVRMTYQVLFLAGAILLWYPISGYLSSAVKTFREKHEKAHFVIHITKDTPCDEIKALVKKRR